MTEIPKSFDYTGGNESNPANLCSEVFNLIKKGVYAETGAEPELKDIHAPKTYLLGLKRPLRMPVIVISKGLAVASNVIIASIKEDDFTKSYLHLSFERMFPKKNMEDIDFYYDAQGVNLAYLQRKGPASSDFFTVGQTDWDPNCNVLSIIGSQAFLLSLPKQWKTAFNKKGSLNLIEKVKTTAITQLPPQY